MALSAFRSRRRFGSNGLMVVALALLGLSFLPPSASAASPMGAGAVHPAFNVTWPGAGGYPSGTAYVGDLVKSHTGCGASFFVPRAGKPSFNLTNGYAQVDVNATLKACANLSGRASYAVRIGVHDLTFTPNASANYTVSSAFNILSMWGAHVGSRTAHSQAVHALVVISLKETVFNTATGKAVGSVSAVFLKHYLHHGTIVGGGAVNCGASCTQLLTLHAALVKGTTYSVRSYIHVQVEVKDRAGTTPGTRAWASVEMLFRSPNEAGYITSVTVH